MPVIDIICLSRNKGPLQQQFSYPSFSTTISMQHVNLSDILHNLIKGWKCWRSSFCLLNTSINFWTAVEYCQVGETIKSSRAWEIDPEDVQIFRSLALRVQENSGSWRYGLMKIRKSFSSSHQLFSWYFVLFVVLHFWVISRDFEPHNMYVSNQGNFLSVPFLQLYFSSVSDRGMLVWSLSLTDWLKT